MPVTESLGTGSSKTIEKDDQKISEAYKQAEADIETDPDLKNNPSKEDDLDEGELARLEGED